MGRETFLCRDPFVKPPRYQELIDSLRRRIESGALPPGTRLPSFAEMRRQESAGQSTVERVYASLEQDGLVRRRQGSGVFVIARSGPAKTSTMAVVGFNLEDSEGSDYWFKLMRGITRGAARAGLDKLFPVAVEERLPWEKFDGVLLHGPSPALLASLPSLMPRVSFMSSLPEMPSVLADNEDGTGQAVRHLLGLGHRRIGYLVWAEWEPMRLRVRGYRMALAEASIEIGSHWIRGMAYETHGSPGSYHYGYRNMKRWLAEGFLETGCTALLVHNDIHAMGAMQALRESGLSVPGDISIVGYDGIDTMNGGVPGLTTIEVPFTQLAEAATDLLARRIREEEVPNTKTLFPVSLRIGESTAAVR